MERGRRLFLVELPLHGAAGLMERRGCFWGSSRCSGLLDRGREEAVSGEAPAARGCSIDGEKRLFLGELPLRGAAVLMEKRGCFWGSSRCSGLLDRGREEAVSGEAPAARGCSIDGEKRLFLGELPLRGAAVLMERRGCFWGSSRCAGLLDGGREKLVFGGAPAARGCRIDGGRQEPVSQGNPAARGCRTDGRRALFLRELPLRGAA